MIPAKRAFFVVVFIALGAMGMTHASAVAPSIVETASNAVADGITHRTVRTSADQVAHVARIDKGAEVAIRPVVARDHIAGDGARLERTSSMCARADCILAINGDFYREQIPVGAVVSAGRLLRSPNKKHHQLSFDASGRPSADHWKFMGKLVPTDLEAIKISGLNVERRKDTVTMYTRAWASETGTNKHGVELILEPVDKKRPMTLIGQTTIVRLATFRTGGDTTIPKGGAVLSGHGKGGAALRALWKRFKAGDAGREALLRIDATLAATESIGGTPILLRDGKIWFENRDNAFTRGRHPRTVVGWNDEGTTWLVVIDGRQSGYSAGATLMEAARFMKSLGATDAINLDGGGSSTFVVRGEVVNRPSDTVVRAGATRAILNTAGVSDSVLAQVERPVSNALVVVPAKALREPLAPELDIEVPAAETVPLPTPPIESDPGSNPAASLPAIVGTLAPPPSASTGRDALVALAVLLNLAGVRSIVWARRRGSVRGT